MLVKIKNKRNFGRLAAAVTLLAFSVTALGQQQWKDQAEFDLYTAIGKETNAAKKIELLNQWKEKYPDSQLAVQRMQLVVVTYQSMGKPAETIAAANELLAKDANNLPALNAILTSIYSIQGPTAEQLGSAEKAANQVLSNLDALFANDKKPQGVTDAQWTQAKDGVKLLAQNTLGYVAMTRKDNDKAETEFAKSLQLSSNQPQISYWLGSIALAKKNYSVALWHYARAAGQNFQLAKDFLPKAYAQYRGSNEEMDKLMEAAKGSAMPPADFHWKSKQDIAQEKFDEEQKKRAANPMLTLWQSIKEQLTGANGAQYFESSMKGAALPAGVIPGVTQFKGKLIEARPEVKPKELVLSIEDGKTPDVTLKLDQPLNGKMEPGGEIAFEGVAQSYTANPFMVTFEVERAKVTGWTGAPAAAKPKPPVRRAPAKKK